MRDERSLGAGDEAGTAPADRRFRPDVQGLRAVAVLLVVFFHAGVARVTGGFVGVDVFFVISGFVITGLLLRERAGSGRTTISHFYARRVRRILPAATVVIVIVVVASYMALGYVSGDAVADDGRWAAVFLANFHFESVGTDYFGSKLPPSPLQNYWSLSVEEQFYVVYPTLFALLAKLRTRLSLHVKLALVLTAVIATSYWLSVAQTAAQPTAAYFSPFTRAWELALGALVAVGTPWLRRLPATTAAGLTWVGLAGIVVAAFTFTSLTPYPGSLVALPVLGAALVIAGGAAAPRWGAESVLGLRVARWFGDRSYSLYLWHWPILIIAAERAGKTSLPLWDNMGLIVVAVAVSAVSYRVVENPVRHWRLPARATVLAGIAVVLVTVLALSAVIGLESASEATYTVAPAPDLAAVLHRVAAATSITEVPGDVTPPLGQADGDWGGSAENSACAAGLAQSTETLCFLGDTRASRLLLVYGDSHALMWLPAFESVAEHEHMKLLVLGKPNCPASLVTIQNPAGIGPAGGAYTACNAWHTWAVRTINRLAPSVLVVTQDSTYLAPGPRPFTDAQWDKGLTALFKAIHGTHTERIFLGNIPLLAQSGPTCLSRHSGGAQACATPVGLSYRPFDQVEYSVTQRFGIRYVDPTPWFCSSECSAVVGPYDVYMDRYHMTATYARYLENVLRQTLFSALRAPTTFKQYIDVRVARPEAGATVSGTTLLVAGATLGDSTVDRVDFEVTGGGRRDQLACAGAHSIVGWLCYWNSSLVPDGHYSLRAVAQGANGSSARSDVVPLTVRNG